MLGRAGLGIVRFFLVCYVLGCASGDTDHENTCDEFDFIVQLGSKGHVADLADVVRAAVNSHTSDSNLSIQTQVGDTLRQRRLADVPTDFVTLCCSPAATCATFLDTLPLPEHARWVRNKPLDVELQFRGYDAPLPDGGTCMQEEPAWVDHGTGRSLLMRGARARSVPHMHPLKPVWDSGATGRSAKVAVLDSGLDCEKMKNKFKHVLSCTDWTTQGSPSDGVGHGTFVAGVVASVSTQCGGVAPDANLHVREPLTLTATMPAFVAADLTASVSIVMYGVCARFTDTQSVRQLSEVLDGVVSRRPELCFAFEGLG